MNGGRKKNVVKPFTELTMNTSNHVNFSIENGKIQLKYTFLVNHTELIY